VEVPGTTFIHSFIHCLGTRNIHEGFRLYCTTYVRWACILSMYSGLLYCNVQPSPNMVYTPYDHTLAADTAASYLCIVGIARLEVDAIYPIFRPRGVRRKPRLPDVRAVHSSTFPLDVSTFRVI